MKRTKKDWYKLYKDNAFMIGQLGLIDCEQCEDDTLYGIEDLMVEVEEAEALARFQTANEGLSPSEAEELAILTSMGF